jgi:hypothetical protein
MLDRARLIETLTLVLDHTELVCSHIEYRLVGTGAALLHGVDLPAGDIDILVKRRKNVETFATALSFFRCLSPPTWLPHAHQYYGNYEVNGVEVGISTVELETESDAIETYGPGPWVHCALLPCGPYTVPTVALELRLITELARQRADRYEPILSFLGNHGCDADLVVRGLDRLGLSAARRDELLAPLQR